MMKRGILAMLAGVVAAKPKKKAFRYWRVLLDTPGPGATGYSSIAEINMRIIAGTAGVMNGTASVLNYYNTDATYNAAKAIDGNTATGWITVQNTVPNNWWKMDFGSGNKRKIVQLALTAWSTTAGAAQMIRGFRLQGSNDDSAWTTVLTVVDQLSWGTSETRLFNVP